MRDLPHRNHRRAGSGLLGSGGQPTATGKRCRTEAALGPVADEFEECAAGYLLPLVGAGDRGRALELGEDVYGGDNLLLFVRHLDDQFGVDLRGAEDAPGGVAVPGDRAGPVLAGLNRSDSWHYDVRAVGVDRGERDVDLVVDHVADLGRGDVDAVVELGVGPDPVHHPGGRAAVRAGGLRTVAGSRGEDTG